MRTIGEILERKAIQAVVTVEAGDSVLAAVRAMDRSNTGSVVVLDGDRVAGIFTERDLMRRVVLQGREVATTAVGSVMTTALHWADAGEVADEAMARMTRHRCRHLPVVDGTRLVGVVSIGDLMKELTDEQTVEIEILKEYVSR